MMQNTLLGADLELGALHVVKEEVGIEGLFSAVRYGLKSQVIRILSQSKEFVNRTDSHGYTVVHWAAKKGDVEMLQLLNEYGAHLNQETEGDTRMLPIHWAASEGKISTIRYLLDNRIDVNAQDGNGCTPLTIATQYNHSNCVVFLIKNGADLSLRDGNGDTAIHWAAYKGYADIFSLLTYYMPQAINLEDNFGQTPLHLAALRGEVSVLEYIIHDCRGDLSKKDRNGLTPLELAIKKNQINAEWCIRRAMHKHTFLILYNMGLRRICNGRVCQLAWCGANDGELGVWPWRIVFLSNFYASTLSLQFLLSEQMNDLYLLHLCNAITQCVWWALFATCLCISPSLVRNDATDTIEYENTLTLIGQATSEENLPAVCHTCRIVRPLRSKHCKVLKGCVNKFDHFCPFVGNTVGRDNYRYFVFFLVTHILAALFWEVTAIFYSLRISVSWLFIMYMIYAALWALMVCGLLSYHIQLLSMNLSTNEHIGLSKYSYLKNVHGMIDNPFDKGNFWKNVYDGLFPSKRSYFTRSEVTGELLGAV